MHPSLTVIMPAHNAEATIAAAIASTLAQTYQDFELWVLENGSTDRTGEIAENFEDRRVRVFELGPVGFQAALQFGIENASSDWLARMDADDLMFPDRLKTQMDVIVRRSELAFVGTAFGLLTPFGHMFERITPDACDGEVDILRMGWGRYFADPSTVFNRQLALDVGGVDPEFTAGDVPLWFRMLQRKKGWEIAETLYITRLRPDSMSRSVDAFNQGIRIRAKYAPEVLHHYPNYAVGPFSAWYSIAGLELLSGSGRAVRQAARSLEAEALATARRFKWFSYIGRVGYALYRLKNPSEVSYRRRPDWERGFQAVLCRHTGNESTTT
jgi:glycosyltransferase involved in cell wall biosynthesis